jgi:shikimate dehydrogenase
MDLYGLIGMPLKHSFSMGFFNEKFASENIDAEYRNFEIPKIKEVKKIIKENKNLRGLNVTIPYKELVIPYLDALSENAKAIGAVNVIKIDRKKSSARLTGYNSDIIGFKQSLEPMLKPHHKRALVLGTGGAAKAVFHGLKQLDIIPTYVSREKKNKTTLTYSEIDADVMETNTVIVNCTPVGMFPNVDECPIIPYNLLTSNHILYDLLYNPDETLFMKRGKEYGATTKNGLEMLLLQAFAAWEFWNN